MRHPFTDVQVRMLIGRAERQLVQVLEHAAAGDPAATHIAKASHAAFHETVVGLITLFRDNMSGMAHVATQVAREYAKGADARVGVPTLACVRRILELVRAARASGLTANG